MQCSHSIHRELESKLVPETHRSSLARGAALAQRSKSGQTTTILNARGYERVPPAATYAYQDDSHALRRRQSYQF